MKLDGIITGMQDLRVLGDPEREVSEVVFDSRMAKPGCLFVAIRGTASDGHTYIPQALKQGAATVVAEEEPESLPPGVTWIVVPNSRVFLAEAAAAWYGHPSGDLVLVGVTGTNGKTTIATLLYQIHMRMGFRAGLLSTIGVRVAGRDHPATHTTPDPLKINRHLREMAEAGCGYCFMEVSSHAIDQARVAGLRFSGGVFTNLTREHLDYHGEFRNYLNAKKRFFDHLPEEAFALFNADDRNGRVMMQNCNARQYSYSLEAMSDFKGRIGELHFEGTSLEIDGREVWVKLPGKFNASNLVCCYAVSVLTGQPGAEVLKVLSDLDPVRGRFEAFRAPGGTTGIIDYAHSPDALSKVLDTIREVNVSGGAVITVVGTGGNRDRGKRPQMARIAVEGSDRVVLTSDNPRNEDPENILDDMEEGVPPEHRHRVLRITDRREAIRTACLLAGDGDVVLVAGKGHETVQIVNEERLPFDDREILREHLNPAP